MGMKRSAWRVTRTATAVMERIMIVMAMLTAMTVIVIAATRICVRVMMRPRARTAQMCAHGATVIAVKMESSGILTYCNVFLGLIVFLSVGMTFA